MKTNRQMADETATAAAEAEVIDMPKQMLALLQLTNEERLKLENLQLKMELAKRQFGALMKDLHGEQERVADEVTGRTGMNLREYDVDLSSGTCRRKEASNGHERQD